MKTVLPDEGSPYESVTAALISSEEEIVATCMNSMKSKPEFSVANMYGWGIARRAVALSHGYRSMVEQVNSIGALPMVRMQLDTALRLYAGFFAPKTHAFCKSVLAGEQVDRMKSDSGQKMKDRYLLERVSKKNPWMLDVYKLTSGYIHFSDKHIKEAFREGSGERELTVVIGPTDQGREMKDFHEPSRCMVHLNMIIDTALSDWFERKC